MAESFLQQHSIAPPPVWITRPRLFPIGLAAGVALVFAIAALITSRPNGNPDLTKSLWIGLGSIPLMFLGNYLTPRQEKKLGWDHGSLDGFSGRARGRYESIVGASTWILFTGPRLLNWSINSFRQARETKQQDSYSCAAILWVLMSRPNRVALDEIPGILDWIDLEATLPQLRYIPGVISLQGPPAGLSLSTDLRTAIRSDKLPE